MALGALFKGAWARPAAFRGAREARKGGEKGSLGSGGRRALAPAGAETQVAVRLPLVSVLLRRDGPLPLSAATAALCAPGLGTASSRAAAATAAILPLPRRLPGEWEAPAQTSPGPPSLLPQPPSC